MTESQEQKNTKSSATGRVTRSLYLWQRTEGTRSQLRDYLAGNPSLQLVTPLDEVRGKKQKYIFRCACGTEFMARPADILRTGQTSCFSCSRREVMGRIVGTKEWSARHAQMNEAAARVNRKDPEFVSLRKRCNGAKSRCTTRTSKAYKNYGGRGIEFRFVSPLAMAEWVIEHLGYPEGRSIDRIDNDGHYEPGNLKWSTLSEQMENRRTWQLTAHTERIRRLCELRPDYTYESIRTFVKKGMTDDEILLRKKHSYHLRHP